MFLFSIMEVLFPLMFLMFFVLFAVTAFRGLSQWNKNNHSPRLTVQASVVSRRDHRSRHHNQTTHTSHTSTTYYATFQFESGDRLELNIPATDFGYLIEGDQGKLTFQGTRFISFERG